MIVNFLTIVGAVVVGWSLAKVLVEALRSFYWSIWVLPPEFRNARQQGWDVSLWRIPLYVWRGFWGEYGSHYDTKECAIWKHGRWPWQSRYWNT